MVLSLICSTIKLRMNYLSTFTKAACTYNHKFAFLSSLIAQRSPLNQKSHFHTSKQDHVKIYTKTGDKGKSSTFAGDRRSKNDRIFEALGAIDELTSSIGIVRELIKSNTAGGLQELNDQLFKIQCILQDLASCVATPKSQARAIHLDRTKFQDSHVIQIEEWIDAHTKQLPELTNFIIPSGGQASSHLHMARAICRRAERRVLPVVTANEVDVIAMMFLNRLSDYMFTVARVAASKEGRPEEIYVKP